ncbi:MAG TPA: oligosaccharide flippase family protein [Anaerolineales bacterium]|jgi:O-antigen/teichoic acid export membrane protein
MFQKITSAWRDDDILRRVVLSSSVLFSSNTISLALSVVQSILAARLLGPAGFGLLAIVMAYASTVNGLLSFRMSELVVRYGGEYLETGEKEKMSALVKAAALSEALVSALSFVVVVVSAGLAATYIAKVPEAAGLFILYSLGLLANFNAETARGVLQSLDKIRLEGVINLVQSILTAALIAFAFFSKGSLQSVLYAYLVGKVVLGLGMFLTAFIHLTRRLGMDWWRSSLAVLPRVREMTRFAISSNLSATFILLFRESEILWVGYFLSSEAAGYYKAAYAIASLLSVPANPLILTTYPELNRLIVQKAWPRLRDFLRKVTSLAAVYNLAIAAGFILFGRWLLGLYGPAYVAAYPALIALLAGLVFNYTLFWNRPLLLSLGQPEFPLTATLTAGLVKLSLGFGFVPRYGYVAEAALLSFYYIASVGAIAWRGMKEIRNRELHREDAKNAKSS